MTDLLSSLAQLKQAREQDEQPTPAVPEVHPASTRPAEALAPGGRGDDKTLAGRVPLALHRELTRGLLDAADELGVRRVNLDEALEAAVRVALRDPQVHQRWLEEIQAVRRERRDT
ncbi:hypothetical protein E7T09_19960 [Deinococcus sp. KSM4-11]|uniref:hypothetical protein n=1 Tax=Deinococcus sp. KSM4-11 TaxID=2568654 RepID=UPI0010A4D9BE|nr:hypothetical protein [Deinococcus sp. KSM4-11]THF84295.1 hypothetical protein E7T09_19960 [Deinococcus sp. KSM4-11]